MFRCISFDPGLRRVIPTGVFLRDHILLCVYHAPSTLSRPFIYFRRFSPRGVFSSFRYNLFLLPVLSILRRGGGSSSNFFFFERKTNLTIICLFPWLRFYCNTVQRSPQVKWTRRSRWTFLALYLFHSRIWVHLHLIFWWIHEENSRTCCYLSCRAPFWPRCPVSCRSRLSLKVTSVACTLKWRLSSSVVTI